MRICAATTVLLQHYISWQEQTLAYYAGASVECVEPEELDEDERLARRRAYLEKEFGSVE